MTNIKNLHSIAAAVSSRTGSIDREFVLLTAAVGGLRAHARRTTVRLRRVALATAFDLSTDG